MTCKDCLYFKRCVVLGVELDMKHDKEADKNCRHFENKADYIKVVRCENCERRNKSADLTSSVLCPWLHNLQMQKNDFCSYGKRSDEK